MRPAVLLLAAFPLACSAKAEPPIAVVHDYFEVKVPGWSNLEEGGTPESGFLRRKRVKRTELIQVGWEAAEQRTEAELAQTLKYALSDLGCEILENTSNAADADFRQHGLCRISVGDKTVFVGLTVVYCIESRYVITLGAHAPKRKRAERLRQQMVDSFGCKAKQPPERTSHSVASTLGVDWGHSSQENVELLGHADGRSVLVSSEVGSFGRKLGKHPQKFIELLGNRMGLKLSAVGAPFQIQSLSGSMPALHAKTGSSPVAIGSLYCEKVGRTYTLLAMQTSGDPAKLSPLLAQFGCPGAGPPASSRSNNCDLPGHEDACIR